MKRRLNHAIVAISFLLFAAVAVMWVRSYRQADIVFHSKGDRTISASLRKGRLLLHTTGRDPAPLWSFRGEGEWRHIGQPVRPTTLIIDDSSSGGRRFLGFGYARMRVDPGPPALHWAVVGIPCWFIALILAIPPSTHLLRARRRRNRARTGHCPTCSYDLRASTGRGPECGAPIPPPTSPPKSDPAEPTAAPPA